MRNTWIYQTGAFALAASLSLPCAYAGTTSTSPSLGAAEAVTLTGNVSPLARPEFVIGAPTADARLERLVLLLQSSAKQQLALDAFVQAQQDPHSTTYHRWLTPAQFAARFGASSGQLVQLSGWLTQRGFSIDEIAASHRLIVFSGTAAQVEDAFHPALRRYQIDDVEHLANSQDPQIPAAFAGFVSGIVSLHDFRRTSAIRDHRPIKSSQVPHAEWSLGGAHYLWPTDFATIYDVDPLYRANITGSGVSLAIVGRSNINLADVAAFRSEAGLPAQVPAVVLAGGDPGLVNFDQDESTLDVEWSGAIAPAASVSLVAGASTATTDGVDLSAAYIVNHGSAKIVSVSYGSCEQTMGATELAFYNSLWEQAASQGTSVFVASGDSGAAGCDSGSASVGTIASVNGLCSSPYATCVGGTEFNEGANPAQYWSIANGAGDQSALRYIPETAWNESSVNGGAGLWASGGGASTIYAQPAWQQNVAGTAAADGRRAVPDVALNAASHDGAIIDENGSYWIISGTSVAAPSFAALMALVVQANGGAPPGNANPALYALLDAPQNPFHATPSGSNTVPGVTGFTAAGASYNLTTGLGSVDATLMVNNWGRTATGPVPTLQIALASTSVSPQLGGNASVAVVATTGGSFTGTIALKVTGLPTGMIASWSANPLASSGTAALTLTAGLKMKAQTLTAWIAATGNGITVTQPLTIHVTGPSLHGRATPQPVGMRPGS